LSFATVIIYMLILSFTYIILDITSLNILPLSYGITNLELKYYLKAIICILSLQYKSRVSITSTNIYQIVDIKITSYEIGRNFSGGNLHLSGI